MIENYLPSQTSSFLEHRFNNLPLQLTSFVGREKDIVLITNLLKVTRLLSITGSGGSGKTRLALQVGANLLTEFAEGVWMVELASISDPRLVPQAVASVLKIKEEVNQPLLQSISRYLYPKKILLILDNCEHLIETCALLSEDLLKTCPQIYILATSREALEIGGETSWRIPILSVPSEVGEEISELEQFEAVRLFVDRARAVNPAFSLTEQLAPFVVKICQRLDGVPLALELAAARTRTLSPEIVAARLDDRFQLLTGGSRNALPRQKTLRGAIDWSYDLLPFDERTLFEGFAIFAGGWTLEAAEVIGNFPAAPRFQIMEGLSKLVNKSLVITENPLVRDFPDNALTVPGESRFFLLETIRQYAREKLVESGRAEYFGDQHLAYYLQLAEKAELELQGKDQVIWLERLEREQDNFRAGLEWAFSGSPPRNLEAGLRLAGSLMNFWDLRCYLAEGRDWLEKGLALSRNWPDNPFRAKALFAAGALAWPQQDLNSANALLTTALAFFQKTNDRQNSGLCLYYLGMVATSMGDSGVARTYFEQSAALLRELGNTTGLATSLGSLGINTLQEGDYPTAHTFLQESARYYREAGDTNRLAYILNYLGELARCENNYLQAADYYKQSIELFEEMGDYGSSALPYHNLAFVYKNLGDYSRAKETFLRGSEVWQRNRKTRFVPSAIVGLAGIAVALNQLKLAAQMFGAFAAFRNSLDTVVARADQLEYTKDLARLKTMLKKDELEKAWQAGLKLSLEEVLKLADQSILTSAGSSQSLPELAPALPKNPEQLSARELEALRLVAGGFTNKQVAEKLSISVRTVETHLNSIYAKLNITSRSAATRYALEHNIN